MDRWIFSALWLCLLTFAAPAEDAPTKPFLWEARHGQGLVYLLGSVHQLRATDHPLHPVLDQVFERADQVAFEIDLDEAMSAAVLLLGVQKGTFPQPDNLAAHLSEQTYARVVQYAQANGIRFYDLYRPWFLNQVLIAQELSKAGFAADFGVDTYFFELAQDQGKPIKALEEASFQINVLASLPEADQIVAVENFLADPAAAVTQVSDLVSAWKRGDAEELERAVENEFRDDPQSFDLLLTHRNRNWLPALEGFLQGGQTTVVVVGAAHMVGEQGLVNLLRQRGYDVERYPREAVVARPRFVASELLPGQHIKLTLEVEVGGKYALQQSSDLKQWTNILEFNADRAEQAVTNSVAGVNGPVFFRLQRTVMPAAQP
jgi:uncharacterized protein